jgi:tetratricopeptide (TPR) repeat protein
MTESWSLTENLHTALAHHQAGRWQDAEKLYQQVLAVEPNNPDALHLLGVIASQNKQHTKAADLIRRAIAVKPGAAEFYNSLAIVMRRLGRLEEAEAAYRGSLRLNPNAFEVHHNLGMCLAKQNRWEQAVSSYSKAIALCPDRGEVYANLGAAHAALGHYDEAVTAYQKALLLKPDFAETLNNLGNTYLEQGKLDLALASLQKAVTLDPERAEFHTNLGVAFDKLGRFDEALAAHERAIELRPELATAYINLGSVYSNLGRSEDAVSCYQKAIQIQPAGADVHTNLAIAFCQLGRLEESTAAVRQAIEIKPQDAEAHFILAATLLLTGQFEEGWREYEWRFQCKGFRPGPSPYSQPEWDGADPAGRTILLCSEQGFGDVIQFCRFAPLVAARGGRVILGCRPPVKTLLQTLCGVEQVVAEGEKLPPFDLKAWIMSLPYLLGTRLNTIPRTVPYLAADPNKARFWHDKLKSNGSAYRIGLVWAGRPEYLNDRKRSIPLQAFAPLAGVRGVAWYSLQKDVPIQPGDGSPLALHDYAADLHDFSDTAALVANLNLVISVDTAVAHLAGALGKPVWTLLPFAPDWRWLLGREDTPWYPTMRLFRQPAPGDWTNVIARLTEELTEFSIEK